MENVKSLLKENINFKLVVFFLYIVNLKFEGKIGKNLLIYFEIKFVFFKV